MKFLEVGDIIELGDVDGSRYSGAGYYLVRGKEPMLNQYVLPTATIFSSFYQFATASEVKEITLNDVNSVDLTPEQHSLYQLIVGVRATPKGGARIWTRIADSVKNLNDKNRAPDTSSYKAMGFIDEWTSPFSAPSMETLFNVISGIPPTFKGMVVNTTDTIQLHIKGRGLSIVKIPETTQLYKKIKNMELPPHQMPQLITSTVNRSVVPQKG